MTFDLAIIGGGPAGAAAGVYAARKRLRTIVVTPDFGGQSTVSSAIYNWIGTRAISGEELAKNLREHLLSYQSEEFVVASGDRVLQIEQVAPSGKNCFRLVTAAGKSYQSRAVLLATGANRRRLTVPGADEFEHKGITYCATCDGPLFTGHDVAVIGGGNAAFETAAQLLAYCRTVTLIHRSETFRADEITVEKIKQDSKIKLITNAELVEFKGEKFLTSLVYKDSKTGKTTELGVTGVFVEIGLIPNTDLVRDLVALNHNNAIVTDPKTQASSLPGLWAAGDCTDALYHQNNIAAGDAVKALENIYQYLHRNK